MFVKILYGRLRLSEFLHKPAAMWEQNYISNVHISEVVWNLRWAKPTED